MILYHGTNVDFEQIDLSKSRKNKDFGRGFYLTDLYDQAVAMANRQADILGGEPIVQAYEFDESALTNGSLHVLNFDGVSAEWALFVFRNRNRQLNFTHDYDIVSGPIADDGVAYLLDRYEEGIYTIEQLAEKLKYRRLNHQYYFGTQRAIALLKRRK